MASFSSEVRNCSSEKTIKRECDAQETPSKKELLLTCLKKQVLEIYAELEKDNATFVSDLPYARDMYVNTELLRPMDVTCMIAATRALIGAMRESLDRCDETLTQFYNDWIRKIKLTDASPQYEVTLKKFNKIRDPIVKTRSDETTKRHFEEPEKTIADSNESIGQKVDELNNKDISVDGANTDNASTEEEKHCDSWENVQLSSVKEAIISGSEEGAIGEF